MSTNKNPSRSNSYKGTAGWPHDTSLYEKLNDPTGGMLTRSKVYE